MSDMEISDFGDYGTLYTVEEAASLFTKMTERRLAVLINRGKIKVFNGNDVLLVSRQGILDYLSKEEERVAREMTEERKRLKRLRCEHTTRKVQEEQKSLFN